MFPEKIYSFWLSLYWQTFLIFHGSWLSASSTNFQKSLPEGQEPDEINFLRICCLQTGLKAINLFSSILETILIEVNHGNKLHLHTLHQIVAANQLGISGSNDPTICNLSTFPCQQSDLQSRNLCGLVKPLCPVLKFSCSLCQFYLSTKTCKKTCQKYEKYCGSSGCSDSSTMPSEPATEITGVGKKN